MDLTFKIRVLILSSYSFLWLMKWVRKVDTHKGLGRNHPLHKLAGTLQMYQTWRSLTIAYQMLHPLGDLSFVGWVHFIVFLRHKLVFSEHLCKRYRQFLTSPPYITLIELIILLFTNSDNEGGCYNWAGYTVARGDTHRSRINWDHSRLSQRKGSIIQGLYWAFFFQISLKH